MARRLIQRVSRRNFIKKVGRVSTGLTAALLVPGRANAQQKTLKILQWDHFVPAYSQWFQETYAKAWGEKNQTSVIIDTIGLPGLNSRAVAEIAAQRGHDLFMFLGPPPAYEDHVIDHRELYEECNSKYGPPIDLAIKSTYNPKTKKYYGFSESYVPDPVHYRKDLWDDVGMYPDTWDEVRIGGKKIKQKHNISIGVGLASDLDTSKALRAIMYSFGASEQDTNGSPALKSRETLEALRYVKALYEEAMTDEVFTWDHTSNNRVMLTGTGSLALNAISITREGETQQLPVTEHIWLARAPRGPVRRLGLEHVMQVYVIWKFADNIEGAKQFLIDVVGQSRQALIASKYANLPCFPRTVPDFKSLMAHDAQAKPTDKYKILEDSPEWITNVGYPGYANAAIDEILRTWVISTMFAQAASGKLSPEDALSQGDQEVRRIFKKWKAKGKV